MNITFSDLNILLENAIEESCLVSLNNHKVVDYDFYPTSNFIAFYGYDDVSLGRFSTDKFEITLIDNYIKLYCTCEKTRNFRSKVGVKDYDVLTIAVVRNLTKKEILNTLEYLK